jgi:hypothetical protein
VTPSVAATLCATPKYDSLASSLLPSAAAHSKQVKPVHSVVFRYFSSHYFRTIQVSLDSLPEMSRHTAVFPLLPFGTTETLQKDGSFLSGVLLLFDAHNTLPKGHRARFVFGGLVAKPLGPLARLFARFDLNRGSSIILRFVRFLRFLGCLRLLSFS